MYWENYSIREFSLSPLSVCLSLSLSLWWNSIMVSGLSQETNILSMATQSATSIFKTSKKSKISLQLHLSVLMMDIYRFTLWIASLQSTMHSRPPSEPDLNQWLWKSFKFFLREKNQHLLLVLFRINIFLLLYDSFHYIDQYYNS